jgi:hypothetical protein
MPDTKNAAIHYEEQSVYLPWYNPMSSSQAKQTYIFEDMDVTEATNDKFVIPIKMIMVVSIEIRLYLNLLTHIPNLNQP